MSYSGISPYGSAYRQQSQPQEQQQEQQRRQSEPKAYRPYQPYRPPTQQPGPSDNHENDSRHSSVASQPSLASSFAKLDLGDSSMAPAPLRLQRKPVSSQASMQFKEPQSPQADQDYKPYSPPSSQHRNSVTSTAGRRTSNGFVAELEGSPPSSRRESNAVQPSSNVPPPKPAKNLETPDSEGLIVVEAEALPSVPGSWPTSLEEQADTGYQHPYAQPQYGKPISPSSPHHEVTQSTLSPPPVQYPSAFQQQAPTSPPVPQPTYTSAPAQPGYQSFSPPQSPPLPSSVGTPAPFTPQYHQPGNYSSAPSPVYSQAPTSPAGQTPPPPPYQQQAYGSPPQSPPPPPPQSTRPTSQYFSGYQCPPTPTLNTSNLPTPPSQQGPFSPTSPQSPTAGGHRHSVSYFPAAYPPRPSPPTQHQPATTLPSPTVTSPSSPFPSSPAVNTGTYPPAPATPAQQPQPTITYTTAPPQPTYSSPTPSFSSHSSSSNPGANKPGGALYNFPSPPTPSLNSKLSINGLKRTAAGLGGAIKNVASVVEVAGREAVKAGRAAAAGGGRESGRESGKGGRRVSGFYGGGW
ncbi:hypothetical protein B0H65DRAFT_421029 [Neurospora tetraspora]|uniref:Uncharacterized protein n=1 Tax=Neurospora tetraspora TaxID=94610 RepID=A0AAE0JJ64_9PEZI|nr:hypothetical protein B0H65DRAFT_421029 [Neurospora tetraspora]